ncbi:FMN-binding glutamate synthase family protein [Luteipulveratus sp. YIM 133132]|uniref:FMN-binding glutamate synthase family protein n=1 Tax=Luteipulveratus flavus TaxID=3031728 RepID=UPI0023B0209A|nr:FMN-binding glutamate synthase family protein [Luteipulveratus sp. YIM 133132]MDE9366060.1 FMN-binding glutamate synthase family protein [Luteipulveratus sp. YIM 133132]
MTKWSRALSAVPLLATAGLAAWDMTQKKHALLRNFPVIGHGRYLLEKIGPELRQYIITSNDAERPFSRDQRSWIYASSKGENNYFGFGTDDDMEDNVGYPVIKHRTFTATPPPSGSHTADDVVLPGAKVLGGPRGRRKAFRPGSVVNVSAMSFGSLSGPAVEAINQGVRLAGALHNTGEGGLSRHHRQGGDLVLQIGTGYFGCRDERGRFDLGLLKEVVASAPVRAIEVKLSQGAKPGLGGVLPAAKLTPEIAQIRGVPLGHDVVSPSRHAEFSDVDSMLDWIERIADETGLPVGIKSAVGDLGFWDDLVEQMARGDRGVDFVTVDGGEGGTGAAPLVFSDAVALPYFVAFTRVYGRFARAGLTDEVTFIGSGRLGLPKAATMAFALGADLVNVAREAMLSIGCIQSQKCHTDTCPTGVATQNPWLVRGLDPALKSVRLATYLRTLRRDLLKVSEAVGVLHPGLIDPDDIELLEGTRHGVPLREVYGYEPGWGRLGEELTQQICALMAGTAPVGGSAAPSATAD